MALSWPKNDQSSGFPALYQRLYELFPQDRRTMAVPFPPRRGAKHGIDILIDWSNIYIGYKQNSQRLVRTAGRVEFNMGVLDLIITRGRPCISKTVAGSGTTLLAEDANNARYLGYTPYRFDLEYDEKLHHKVERGVDEVLCFQLNEIVRARVPGTIILATGDGQRSGLNREVSFYTAVERALHDGWTVELYSFGAQLSYHWNVLKDQFGARFVYVYLDEFLRFLGIKEKR